MEAQTNSKVYFSLLNKTENKDVSIRIRFSLLIDVTAHGRHQQP